MHAALRLFAIVLAFAAVARTGAADAAPPSPRPPRDPNAGGKIALAPDDRPAFVEPPAGFDVPCDTIPHGRIETVEYDSKSVGARRKMLVYTPPRYTREKKYPVLYLLHGVGGDETEWNRFALPGVILDNLIADGKAVEMIAVMPNGRALPDDRAPKDLFSPENFAGFAAFDRDLFDDVIPTIDARYGTLADPEHRALAGLSMGGGQTLNFGLSHLDRFAWIGAFSPAPNTKRPAELVPQPEAVREKLRLLWLSCGRNDGLITLVHGVHAWMKDQAVPHIWHVDGHAHDTPEWRSCLYWFAQHLFPRGKGGERPPPPTTFAAPSQPTETEALATRLAATPPIAPGAFQPTWASLAANYRCPEWFRDAKFGIWAHWSAQCVPEVGDWYARDMYLQGTRAYQYHVEHYGHPSQFGFMELDHLWTAEKWEPEKLMALYKRAGAKYFVALANHHDNFDAYDSKYQPWNSVNVGAKKDIVGTWAKVARENGLRFGVSNHSSHAWHWFQPAYGSDVEGPLAGVPYDAARLTKAAGKGTWWEGLDPHDLYGGLRIPAPKGFKTAKEASVWHRDHDQYWYESIPPSDRGYAAKWFLRTQDLIDKYQPDLLYFDDTELPLEQYGLAIAAHFYNANRSAHGGSLEAVLNTKHLRADHAPAVVPDIERGVAEAIRPQPWQTDTCIGSWHYDRRIFEQHKYKTTGQVVRMLVDIVSKNGNLLLSVPVRGDGTIDDDEITFLEGMARWMDVNGDAIFGTRPWAIYGEGPAAEEKSEGGQFGGARDVRRKPYTAEDVRFTKKGDAVYAILMAWPENNTAVIKSFASKSPHLASRRVSAVALLGAPQPLSWSQDDEGMRVTLPTSAPCEHAFVLKITTTAAQ